MEFETSDHVVLDYTDEGQGQPIVILTGFGGAKVIWRSQVSVLIAAGYRVINVDSRNHGLSMHTDKGLRISRLAMDVYELMQALQLQQPIVMGNSMGAAIWFAYVSLFGDDGLKAVIDVDQSPKMLNTPDWSYGFKDVIWADFPEFFYQPLGSATYQHIDNLTYQAVKRIAKIEPFDNELTQPLLIDHAFQDWRDVVAQLTVPLLIIAGGQSPYFNPEFAAVTAKLAVRGQSVVVPEAGHIVMAEQADAFNQAMLRFLTTI